MNIQMNNKMKILIFILSFMILTSNNMFADTLSWTANTDDAVGYKVYSGIESGNYDKVKNVGNVTAYVLDDSMNNRHFAITSYDKARNESDYSEEVQYIIDDIPPRIPGKPIIKYSIEFE